MVQVDRTDNVEDLFHGNILFPWSFQCDLDPVSNTAIPTFKGRWAGRRNAELEAVRVLSSLEYSLFGGMVGV